MDMNSRAPIVISKKALNGLRLMTRRAIGFVYLEEDDKRVEWVEKYLYALDTCTVLPEADAAVVVVVVVVAAAVVVVAKTF
jgi:hypothetical protein